MLENQDIEFKSVWKDEYLKWICGMANANGGIMYIGKDDKGKVIGVNNAIKLVKEVPNKIKDTMGIIPEVKIEEENDLLYLVIKIEQYPMPISYQGKFYLRGGSNNHEVSGVMVKCNPSKIYMDLLGEIKGKNVQINVHKNVQIKDYEKLTKIEIKILDVILEDAKITQSNIAERINTTPKTVQRGIATLKEKGIIERVGSNKKGYWNIINK